MNKDKSLFPFYILSHPFDGFYEVRHRGRGSVAVALVLVFLFGLSYSIARRYAGFVVNDINPRTVNSVLEVLGVMLAAILFAVANWSITCLMEGEGRFKDILTVTGYSMLPMVLTFIPATILSWFIAADEEAIYHLINDVSVVFFVVLLVIGIMTVHGYSFSKTLLTFVLTFVSIMIIIFIVLLLIYLVNQVYLFLEGVYTELILRV